MLRPRPERRRPRPSRGRRRRRPRRAAWPRRSGAAGAGRSGPPRGRPGRSGRRTARRRAGRPGPGRARRCRPSGDRGRARRCGRAAGGARRRRRRPGPRRVGGPARRPSRTSATTQVTLSVLPASRLARTSSTAAYSGLPVERMSAIRPSSSTPQAPSLQTSSRSPRLEVDDEEVGLAVADRVDRPHDQVAVRVDPRLVLGDPALVDEGLHEGVVEGQLADGAVAVEVGAAVADVADAEPGAVEGEHGRGGAGAVEGGVLVDQLDQPVVGAVDGAGDPGEQLLGRVAARAAASRRRSWVIAVAEAMSPRAAPPTPSQTASSHGPAYPESWLSCGPGRRRRPRRSRGAGAAGRRIRGAVRSAGRTSPATS